MWISVKERLPQRTGYYFVAWKSRLDNEYRMGEAHYDTLLWTVFCIDGNAVRKDITHWAIPDPPKEG